jgi:hypothetical protein
MKLFKRNGVHLAEIDVLKDESRAARIRVERAARRLAQATETVARQRKENEMVDRIQLFRKYGEV